MQIYFNIDDTEDLIKTYYKIQENIDVFVSITSDKHSFGYKIGKHEDTEIKFTITKIIEKEDKKEFEEKILTNEELYTIVTSIINNVGLEAEKISINSVLSSRTLGEGLEEQIVHTPHFSGITVECKKLSYAKKNLTIN